MVINRIARWIVGVCSLLLLSGCTAAPSSLSPKSTSARAITELMWGYAALALLGFFVVETLLIFVLVRFQHKEDGRLKTQDLPKQIEGNRSFELAWTLTPAVLLLIIFVFTVTTLWAITNRPANASADPPVVNVTAIGHQWWWEFQYPDQKITTANEMHVPVDTLIYITVDSVDVIHSFWVPQMGGKIDTVPGHLNHTWFQPTETGTYVGECSEYCGTQHANMRMNLIVETLDAYNAWVSQQQAPLPTLTGDAAQGEQVFLNGSCVGCHTIDGTKASGKVGPNLTHIASRQFLAGGVITNTPDNLASWLADPPSLKEGVKMPKLGLSDVQIKQLVAFLESLK